MANWVYIENGEIVEYHDLLPKNWRHVSGLNMSANDLNFLKSLGWFKVLKEDFDLNLQIEKLSGFRYEFRDNQVFEYPIIVQLTQGELDSIKNQNFILFLTSLRSERDQKLKESDWTQTSDVVKMKSLEWNNAWSEYRQQLRDLPASFTEPGEIIWPNLPNVTS